MPIKLISTDFDGTLFAEFENPPIPEAVHRLIGDLQSRGAKWVINTGRDMSSLMEALARSQIPIEPDYLVLVEREIYCHADSQYLALEEWNSDCARAHAELFARVRADLPRLVAWISARFHARLYEDAYSPFCLIAGNNGDADIIHEYLTEYCRSVPQLTLVRNDVYARFSHEAFNKGTALAELTRRLGLSREAVFAAGDQLNDLPMLSRKYARWLVAPSNAVEPVKQVIRHHEGYVSELSHGNGVAEGLEFCLASAARLAKVRAESVLPG
ncbi:MAG: HAD family hydrolase [Verrucomicrobia bacterium]|nr:HAD family hydrolase [Verrucomicrobiota bacterium]